MKNSVQCLIFIVFFTLCGCSTSNITQMSMPNNSDRIQKDELIELTVGNGIDDDICRLGKDFNPDSSVIEAIYPGKFVSENDNYLIILRPKAGIRISHALSFYHRYTVVVNKSLNKIISKPKCFEADSGLYSVLSSYDMSYFLFLGSVEYQGDIQRSGGIYEISSWNRIWPSDDTFWENHSVDYKDGKLRVYIRVSNNWVYSYSLFWDENYGKLNRIADHN